MEFTTVLCPDYSVYLPDLKNTPHATHQQDGFVFAEWKTAVCDHNFAFPRTSDASALELAKRLIRIAEASA